jgi:hypothetical protein
MHNPFHLDLDLATSGRHVLSVPCLW